MANKNKLEILEKNVLETINRFKLIKKEDKIACAVSGGKDSTALLYILSKHFLNIEAITINAVIGNYSQKNLDNIIEFCAKLGVKLHVVSFREEFGYSLCYIQSLLKSNGTNMNSCAICGVLKRYLLNKKARELGMSKLATGHNTDDEAQSIMMNMLRGNFDQLAKLGPISGIRKDSKFVQRIKPLYLIREKDIESYSKEKGFPVKYGRCPCSATAYRNTLRNLVFEYEEKHPETAANVIDYFLKHIETIKRNCSIKGEVLSCEVCGEPSKNKICKACEIISIVKEKP